MKLALINILKRILFFPVTRIILGFAICIIIPVLLKDFLIKPILYNTFSNAQLVKSIQDLLSTTLVLIIYYYFYKLYEKRRVTELSGKNVCKEALAGFALSFSLITIIVGILFLSGFYKIVRFNGFNSFLSAFISIGFLALTEEVLFRGIIFRTLEDWLGTIWALIIPSILFGIAHIANENLTFLGIIGIIVGGFLLNIMYSYTKSLWLPIFFHFGWNLFQLVYGSNISGTDNYNKVLEVQIQGPKILAGSIFGVEDSIFAVLVCTILFVIMFRKMIKEGRLIKPNRETNTQMK